MPPFAKRKKLDAPSWSRVTLKNGVTGIVAQSNGHAVKVSGFWYHQDDVVIAQGENECKVLIKPHEELSVSLGPLKITAPKNTVRGQTYLEVRLSGENDISPCFDMSFADSSQPQSEVQFAVETRIDLRTQGIELVRDGRPVPNPVFFDLDQPRTAYASTQHFSTFEFKLSGGSSALVHMDGVVDAGRPAGQGRHGTTHFGDEKEAQQVWQRGGYMYLLPYRCTRIAIKCDETEWIGNDTIVGYHGVPTTKIAELIIKDGFKLPSQLRGVLDGHIPLSTEVFGIENWADAIFLSPTPKYCMSPTYAAKHTLRHMAGQPGKIFSVSGSINPEGKLCVCLLQCRIKKVGLTQNPRTGKYVFPDTSGLRNCDVRVSGDELEYRVADPSNVQVVGLCIRAFDATTIRQWLHDSRAI